MMMSSMEKNSSPADPPFNDTYRNLFKNPSNSTEINNINDYCYYNNGNGNGYDDDNVEECELPLIDLEKLKMGWKEREDCKKQIAKASKEWGFFQVLNHGISLEILDKMRSEQYHIFKKPFDEKLNLFAPGSYRWGAPSATCLKQLSWSEAFHLPLTAISNSGTGSPHHHFLSSTMEKCATTMCDLGHKLAEILAENLGNKYSSFFRETCLPSTCYLRLNRYPPCPISSQVFGLMPHTDSDFITVLSQDQIGGLQLVKEGKWIAVKPNPEALIINIGDLFQAWSNGVYKSVEHRVVTNMWKERFSIAFFMCPSYDTVIHSCVEDVEKEDQPSIYRRFSFQEYRDQVQDDVKNFGHKIGLPRFLI